MPVRNSDISAAFIEIADLLATTDANPFRIRAYRKAARTVAECGIDLPELVAQARPLPKLPGIGKDLAAKIAELSRTGGCDLLTALRRGQAPTASLLAIPGLGPKRVRTLIDAGGIRTPAQLLQAAVDGRLRALPGFGEQLERRLLDVISRQRERRRRREEVAPVVEKLLRYLRAVPGVTKVDIAGSYRRGRDTVGDLDIVAAGFRDHMAGFALTVFDDVDEILMQGTRRVSVLLKGGLQVDLCIVNPSAYGAALLYFTGSRDHCIALRRFARHGGLKLNEYGLFQGARRLAGRSEVEVYGALGLPFIEPELREDRGEIAAAQAGHLPHLVRRADLRGVSFALAHGEDVDTDLRALATSAGACGLQYMLLCIAFAPDSDVRQCAVAWQRWSDAVAAMAGGNDVAILKAVETAVREDGRLTVPDEILQRADMIIAAIDNAADAGRALEHPAVDVLALTVPARFSSAEATLAMLQSVAPGMRAKSVALRIDARSAPPDMAERYFRIAGQVGVPILMAPRADERSVADDLERVIVQARRAWLAPRALIEHMTLAALRRWLERRRRTGGAAVSKRTIETSA